MIQLTNIERDRFAVYLEQGAESDEMLAKQIEKLGPPELAKKYRTEAMAARIIVAKLQSTTTETL